MFANCFGRLNAIYLNTYILKALKKEELKAILVHELAHFHRYLSPLNRNEWVATLISTASIFLLFTLIPQLILFSFITKVDRETSRQKNQSGNCQGVAQAALANTKSGVRRG